MLRHHKFLAVIFLAVLAQTALLSGCTGTRAAYSAAHSPDQIAYVVTEHYAALVHEAANLKESGVLTGSALAAVQAADDSARPIVLQLRALSDAYVATHSAKDAAALQEALDKAAIAVSNFINLLKGVRR